MNPAAWDIYKRFHQEVYEDNDKIEHDIKAIEMVSEQVQEEVHYKRPHFNFPIDGHQSSLYGLQEQGTQVLKKAGFTQEAQHLNFFLRAMGQDMQYQQFVEKMFYFLDFSNGAFTPQQRTQLEQIAKEFKNRPSKGVERAPKDVMLDDEALIDEDQNAIVQVDVRLKNTLKNNLPVLAQANSAQKQWQFLRGKAGQVNAFGKSALFSLSEGMYDQMVSSFLQQLWQSQMGSSGAAPVQDDKSMSLQEFEQLYPMGFMDLDYLHGSVMMQHRLSIEMKMGLALWELVSKAHMGMPLDQVRLLGWDHKDQVGVRGSALWAQQMVEVFIDLARPENTQKTAHYQWMQVVKQQFAELKDFTNAQLTWLVYQYADGKNTPELVPILEKMVKDQEQRMELPNGSFKKCKAQMERLALVSQSVPWERLVQLHQSGASVEDKCAQLSARAKTLRL